MFYTHSKLDRADHLRKDETVQTRLYEADNALLLPVWRGKLLVGEDDSSAPRMLCIATSACPAPSEPSIFLGLVDKRPIFAQSLSSIAEDNLSDWLTLAQTVYSHYGNIRFDDLRAIGPSLFVKNEGALMAYARGLSHWHDNARYCVRCGHALYSTPSNRPCRHHAGHPGCHGRRARIVPTWSKPAMAPGGVLDSGRLC